MTDRPVSHDRENGTLTLRLNRPQARNAFNLEMIDLLRADLAAAADDPGVAVIVLGSTDPVAFSAGMDMKESTDPACEVDERLYDLQWELESLAKPVVGALDGYVFGGGAEIALSADVRVGSSTTRFCFPATRYGLVQGSWHLIDVVGWGRAKELVLTGRVVQASEAVRLGLLHEVHDEPLSRAQEIAASLALRSSASMGMVKQLFLASGSRTLEERFAAERSYNVTALRGPEVQQRMQAPRSKPQEQTPVHEEQG